VIVFYVYVSLKYELYLDLIHLIMNKKPHYMVYSLNVLIIILAKRVSHYFAKLNTTLFLGSH